LRTLLRFSSGPQSRQSLKTFFFRIRHFDFFAERRSGRSFKSRWSLRFGPFAEGEGECFAFFRNEPICAERCYFVPGHCVRVRRRLPSCSLSFVDFKIFSFLSGFSIFWSSLPFGYPRPTRGGLVSTIAPARRCFPAKNIIDAGQKAPAKRSLRRIVTFAPRGQPMPKLLCYAPCKRRRHVASPSIPNPLMRAWLRRTSQSVEDVVKALRSACRCA
jgi:hypothetical protein